MNFGFNDNKEKVEVYEQTEIDAMIEALTQNLQEQINTKANASALDAKANVASPTFTGTPKAPTPANTVNNTQLATTAFVRNLLNVLFPVGSTRISSTPMSGSGAMGYDDIIGHWSYVSTTLTVQGGTTPTSKTYYLYTRTS